MGNTFFHPSTDMLSSGSSGTSSHHHEHTYKPVTYSFTNPGDNIPTPQEPAIRQAQDRYENAKETFNDAAMTGAATSVGGAISASQGQPITTTLAGNVVVHQYDRMYRAYNTMNEAKATFDQKCHEERQYLANRNNR